MSNTPRIRFKGYTDVWEQRKLGEAANEFKSGVSLRADEIEVKGAYPVYGGNGLRGYTSTYNHDGEFALIGRQGALCGNMTYSVGRAYFTEHAVAVQADENNDTRFIYYLLDTMQLGQYSDQSAQPGLAVNKLIKLENMFPNKSEQIRISTYFANIDYLITLHQRKCDEAKELKKYMIRKMFPQNGKKIPEIRFAGFTDEWEQRKLSECAGFRRGSFPQPYGKKEWYDGEGAMPFVQVADVADNMKLVDDTKQKISKPAQPMSVFAEKGSVLVTLQGSIGRVAITQYGAFVDRTVLIFDRYNKDIDKVFWAYIIKEKFIEEAKKAPGGTIKTITKEALSNFDLMLPSYDEQLKLGTYLGSIDNIITLHQHKCDELKEVKKFMLQNMFPQKG
ncbi:MAG: restriction endonuclease subunit S [Roseburia sp.]|nr:restriction endonuclease subunit S [Roseburia sp.]